MARNFTPRIGSEPAWHKVFLAMLPRIRRQASIAFRDYDPEAREELVEEVVANVLVALVRLFERGKAHVAYPTVLAKYAVAQVRDGRRVGSSLNVKDVLSPYAQQKKGFVVEHLDSYDRETGQWREAVIEDHQTPVPDQVAFRIDFPSWLAIHTERDRRIAESLATGESTNEVAREFEVSAGRISQLRRKFYHSWQEFHGECTEAA